MNGQMDLIFRRCKEHKLPDEAWALYEAALDQSDLEDADLMMFNAALGAVRNSRRFHKRM